MNDQNIIQKLEVVASFTKTVVLLALETKERVVM